MTATITDTGGWSTTSTDNLVVLSDNNTNFQASNQGNNIGATSIPRPTPSQYPASSPGTYRLSAYERGQFGELRMNNVVANADGTTTITGLNFVPESFGIRRISPLARPIGPPTNLNSATYAGQRRRWISGITRASTIITADLANSAVPGAVDYYATAVGSTPATNSLANFPMNQWYQFDPNEYAAAYNSSDTTMDGYSYVVAKTAPYVGNPPLTCRRHGRFISPCTPATACAEKYVVLPSASPPRNPI